VVTLGVQGLLSVWGLLGHYVMLMCSHSRVCAGSFRVCEVSFECVRSVRSSCCVDV